ncbi:MAG: sigma-70 family RNA polymerase sigma factor [Anaerolineae bacterium]|nr:sigma-70 family RNA polymerase sigma factor [Anaerolineae bacterium]
MGKHTTFAVGGGNPVLAEQMAKHERLVHWVVRRQWRGDLSFEDALHEGRIGLWSALQHYDPRRGTAFSTYAVPAIAHAVWRAVALEHRLSSSPSLEVPWAADTDEIEPIDDALVHTALHDLAAQLPVRLRYTVVAHHGLDGNPPQTFAAIGGALGVSRQRAHQLHVQALLWLAHPAHSLWLRRLLGRNSRRDYQRTLARAGQIARRKHRRASGCPGRGEAQQ